MSERHTAVTTSSNRAFGIAFALFFAVIGVWPWFSNAPVRLWAFFTGAAILAMAIAAPGVLGPFNRVWLGIGLLMHRVTSPIVLAVMFFLVITPLGRIMRAAGKRPLKIGFEPDAKSYWIDRPPPDPARESMRNQF